MISVQNRCTSSQTNCTRSGSLVHDRDTSDPLDSLDHLRVRQTSVLDQTDYDPALSFVQGFHLPHSPIPLVSPCLSA